MNSIFSLETVGYVLNLTAFALVCLVCLRIYNRRRFLESDGAMALAACLLLFIKDMIGG